MFRKSACLILLVASLWFTASCEKNSQANANKPQNKAEEIAEREKKNRESRQESINKEAAEIEKRIQNNPAIAQLISKYNAVPYWEKELENLRQIFTINVQESLVRSDKRPILLIVQIDDVLRENDKYHLNFESITHLTDIYVTLDCDADQMNKVTNQGSSPYDEYAIIADISSVRKLKFNISASPQSADEAEIELNTSDTFTATGRCLDLLNIGRKE